jgi:hypothetical protein
MMKKLLQKIENSFTMVISSNTEVYKDEYIHGEEMSSCNYFENASKTYNNLNILENIKNYIEDILYRDYDETELKESLYNSCLDSDYFFYSNFVDEDNTTPSSYQVAEWKKGNENLYNQYICISVTINGTEISCDDIIDYCFKG